MSVPGALASLTIADFVRDRGSPKCVNNPFCLGTEALIHTEGGQSGHLAWESVMWWGKQSASILCLTTRLRYLVSSSMIKGV